MSDLLGKDTALCSTLWMLKDVAQKIFFDILKGQGEKLLLYPPLIAVDLSPPEVVMEGASVLLEIIGTHESMIISASGKNPDFDPVISAILGPISSSTSSIACLATCGLAVLIDVATSKHCRTAQASSSHGKHNSKVGLRKFLDDDLVDSFYATRDG